MKKKHRKITVNGILYAWSIRSFDHDSGESLVILWKDKKIIGRFSTVEEEINPQRVAKEINNLIDIPA